MAEHKIDWGIDHPQYNIAKDVNSAILKYGCFTYDNMISIYTYPDGSCLIHAVLNGFFKPYRSGMIDNTKMDRKEYVKEVRKDISLYLESNELLKSIKQLSDKLNDDKSSDNKVAESKIAENNKVESPYFANLVSPRTVGKPSKKTIYEQLGNGNLLNLSKHAKNMTLESLQSVLNSTSSLEGDVMFEVLINYFNVNIFVLDSKAFDVSVHASADEKLRLPETPCVVLLHLPNHYELVGIRENNKIDTCFKLDNPFIKAILTRINLLKGNINESRTPAITKTIPDVPRKRLGRII